MANESFRREGLLTESAGENEERVRKNGQPPRGVPDFAAQSCLVASLSDRVAMRWATLAAKLSRSRKKAARISSSETLDMRPAHSFAVIEPSLRWIGIGLKKERA